MGWYTDRDLGAILMAPKRELARCAICGGEYPSGEGIRLLGHHVCVGCEQIILHSSVEDPVYCVLVDKLRAIWKDVMPIVIYPVR